MKTANKFIVVISFISLIGFTGCLGVNAEFRNLRNDIFENTSIEFKKEIEFSVGPSGMLLAGMFVKFADDEEGRSVGDMLGQISRVQIGVYENRDFRNNLEFGFLKEIDEKMNENGWHYIIRAVENDDIAAVYIKDEEEDILREVFVVSHTDEVLVLANIYGDLNKLVEVAVRQNGIHFERVNN